MMIRVVIKIIVKGVIKIKNNKKNNLNNLLEIKIMQMVKKIETKNTIQNIIKIFLVLILFSLMPSIAFSQNSPLEVVKITVDKIIVAVETYPSKEETDIRRKTIRKIIEPAFNFEAMAKLSLGHNWKDTNETEQKEYVALFSDLLATTYLKKIDLIKKDTVIFKGHRERQDQALVKTDINYNNDQFPIVYKMRKELDGKWRVHDISIENISLVSNYRSVFAGIVRKDGIAGLIEQLKNKVKKEE